MGYWEQIGEANRQYRERRSRMHPFRRALTDAGSNTLIIGISIAIWVVILAPLWILGRRWFG